MQRQVQQEEVRGCAACISMTDWAKSVLVWQILVCELVCAHLQATSQPLRRSRSAQQRPWPGQEAVTESQSSRRAMFLSDFSLDTGALTNCLEAAAVWVALRGLCLGINLLACSRLWSRLLSAQALFPLV